MRLMLGHNGLPWLLVTTSSPTHDTFEFDVINGAWDGSFDNGTVTVHKTGYVVQGCVVLCDDQLRLQSESGWEYQVVFDNFDNPDYVGKPMPATVSSMDWDDDVPF